MSILHKPLLIAIHKRKFRRGCGKKVVIGDVCTQSGIVHLCFANARSRSESVWPKALYQDTSTTH
jgi:hypothetical protein